MEKNLKFLIVASNFYPEITSNLIKQTTSHLDLLKCKYEKYTVTGSLEVPTLISILLKKKKYDAVIALGCIIRGETQHYQFISSSIVNSISSLSIKYSVPISNAILNCENMEQAKIRSSEEKDKSKEAVEAALSVLKNIQD